MTRQLLTAAFALALSCIAQAADRGDIMAAIHQYIQHEQTGNMIAQGQLMTDDRSMLYVGGRLTADNNR